MLTSKEALQAGLHQCFMDWSERRHWEHLRVIFHQLENTEISVYVERLSLAVNMAYYLSEHDLL